MTLSQFLYLLAILVWPFVAIVGAIAFLRGCVLLVDCVDRCRGDWRQVTTYNAEINHTAEIERARDLIRRPNSSIRKTCERALLAILQANGGFPGARNDHVTRQMVREIREMYAELDAPTPVPPEPEHEYTEFVSGDLDFSKYMDDAADASELDELDELDELSEELS